MFNGDHQYGNGWSPVAGDVLDCVIVCAVLFPTRCQVET